MIEQKPDLPNQSAPSKSGIVDGNLAAWNPQQTLFGVLLTLVPWIVFNLASNAANNNANSVSSLPPSLELAGAFLTFILAAVLEGVFLIAPYYYANKMLDMQNWQQARSRVWAVFQSLGLRRFRVWRALLWIVILLLLVILVEQIYAGAISIFHLNIQTNDEVILKEGASQPLIVYGLLAASVFVAPFCEEIFFRGFLFTGLLRELSPIWAMLISAALFAIAHLDPGSFIPLFAIGVSLAYLRWRTRSTWPGMIFHFLNNALSSALIILALHHININLP